jgi:hypothetical protein
MNNAFNTDAVAVGRQDAERIRAARGFSSMRAWRNANLQATRQHRAKAKSRRLSPQERAKYEELVRLLESDFEKYIRRFS